MHTINIREKPRAIAWNLAFLLGVFASVCHAQVEQSLDLAPRVVSGGVLFQFRSPDAACVHLAANFNRFADNVDGLISATVPPMDGPNANGVFQVVVPLPAGLYRYKFAVDYGRGGWFPPSYARRLDDEGNAYILLDGRNILDHSSIAHRPLISRNGITFEFYRPDAHIVYLAADFNHWAANKDGRVTNLKYAMRGPDNDGIWRMTIPFRSGRLAYMYVINGNKWLADPLVNDTDQDGHSIVEIRP